MMQNLCRSPSVSYSRSGSFNRRSVANTGSHRARLNLPSAVGWFSRIQILPFVVGFLVTFLVAICAGYSLVVPSLRHTFHLDNPSEGTSSNSSATELLQKNLLNAKASLEVLVADLQFLRDQYTITQVTIARVYNWDVHQRRTRQIASPSQE